MREWIDLLNETTLMERTHSIFTAMKEEVVVVENPNAQQLSVWLDRYHELRGMIDDTGKVYIWNAMKMTHFGAEMQLGVKIEIGFYIRRRADDSTRVACRWADYTGDTKSPEDFDSFNRMMRNVSPVLGQSSHVFDNTSDE